MARKNKEKANPKLASRTSLDASNSLEDKGYTARPKQVTQVKYPQVTYRTPVHARYDCDLPNLDKEISTIDLGYPDFADGENLEDALLAQIDGERDSEEAENELRERRLEIIGPIIQRLTEQQAVAVALDTHGASQRAGAEVMGISQPYFHEVLKGKGGIGGAYKKLQKLAKKHPIVSG